MSYSSFGYVGALLLSMCAAPQAYLSWKNKNSDGISWMFLIMWTLGEVLTLIYVLPKKDIPLILNYFTNIVLLSIIIYYKGVKHGRSK